MPTIRTIGWLRITKILGAEFDVPVSGQTRSQLIRKAGVNYSENNPKALGWMCSTGTVLYYRYDTNTLYCTLYSVLHGAAVVLHP